MGFRNSIRQWRIAARGRRRRAALATAVSRHAAAPGPPPVAPVWPIPRPAGGPSDDAIRAIFARFSEWHYPFEFDGGLQFPVRYRSDIRRDADRHLQRFAHFMPALVAAAGGTLRGKRILDVACNAGFWSMQCALLGAAEVVGFDARGELIDAANAIKDIAGLDNLSFQQLDIDDMTPERLAGTFDIVLHLGLLYHLPSTLEPLSRALAMTRGLVLLDTAIDPATSPIIRLSWEEPVDVTTAHRAGVVAFPSRGSIELLVRHLGARGREIPLRSLDMPPSYLDGRRASWLIDRGVA